VQGRKGRVLRWRGQKDERGREKGEGNQGEKGAILDGSDYVSKIKMQGTKNNDACA
jgi:hypothetical protein